MKIRLTLKAKIACAIADRLVHLGFLPPEGREKAEEAIFHVLNQARWWK